MGKFIDITGQKFGRLTAISYSGIKAKHQHWLCRCDCGSERDFRTDGIKSGRVASCGCVRSDISLKENFVGVRYNKFVVLGYGENPKYGMLYCRCDCGNEKHIRKHALENNEIKSCGCLKKQKYAESKRLWQLYKKEYSSWAGMKDRVNNPNCESYKHYGLRGISIWHLWENSFETFLNDMGVCPFKNYSLERIDVNGNYEPSNCKWASATEQSNNTRRNRRITYNGVTKTATQWSVDMGFDRRRVNDRLKKGWNDIDAITTPPRLGNYKKSA